MKTLLTPLMSALLLAGCASQPALRGTADLGIIIERASGHIRIVENSTHTQLANVGGLGDLSHAAAVFSRDGRFAYVFGRDGGISKVDLLTHKLVKRVLQAGNSIGGAISSDGRIIAAQNYQPGGVKLFDADTLELLADIPALDSATGVVSKVVGLADLPGHRFAFSLFEAGQIWVIDASNPRKSVVTRYPHIGQQPYDGLATMDGRSYMAGLYGEDGVALLDTWYPEKGVTKVLNGYGQGAEKQPVYKMPHLRGWSVAGDYAFFPSIGHKEAIVADNRSWEIKHHIPLAGQPVFVMARPDGKQVWTNFAFPDNDTVQVIDVPTMKVVSTFKPCKGVLHFEFTARGDQVWLSCRDENRVEVYDTQTLARITTLPADNPSGIFFGWRAGRLGM